jgi:hypothetical protein
MKRAEIKKNGVLTHKAELPAAELDAWLAKHIAKGTFGRGAYKRELTPAVLDENGVEISPATYETVPADYDVIVKDITEEYNQGILNQEAMDYLSSTDWYVIREFETGVKVPADIKAARALARTKHKRETGAAANPNERSA